MSYKIEIVISQVNPPIPTRKWDWSAHFAFDQSDEPLTGWGPTPDDAVADLLANSQSTEIIAEVRRQNDEIDSRLKASISQHEARIANDIVTARTQPR